MSDPCDCRWCNQCAHQILDGPFIVGYCQKRRDHEGDHRLDGEDT